MGIAKNNLFARISTYDFLLKRFFAKKNISKTVIGGK